MSKDQTLTRKRKRYKLGQEQDQTLTRKGKLYEQGSNINKKKKTIWARTRTRSNINKKKNEYEQGQELKQLRTRPRAIMDENTLTQNENK